MAKQVAPSATYEATISWGSSGATLGLRVIDNAGATAVARATTNITEYPAGSGIYSRTGNVAPATAGQYTLVWDDDGGTAAAGHVQIEDLLVTTEPTAATISSGNLYVTRAALKATLNITTTYADDDIDIAVSAASRAIDGYNDDRYYPTSETRYYSPSNSDWYVEIDSLNTLTSVAVDTDGNGTYETTWANATDFILKPSNAATDGIPYRKLELVSQSGRRFSGYQNGLRIVGSFGWAACPAVVSQAATILAGRFLKRARETPYGILVVTGDAVAAARLGNIDPDISFLLHGLRGDVNVMAL